MNEVLSSWDSSEGIGVESIANAMFSSTNPEELLKIFLTSLGGNLAVNRAAIYQFIDHNQGKVLVEAVSQNYQSIRNQIYPINYFGIACPKNYPCDRPVVLSDLSQITETLTVHNYWQSTQVNSMMSAPILLDEATSINQIWGLAFVQQCDRSRIWKPHEADFLFKMSQVLSQCLQYWQLRLRSPAFSKLFSIGSQYPNQPFVDNDQEEFIAKRVELSPDLEEIPTQTETGSEEIAVSSSFNIPDDEDNEILDRVNFKSSQTSINQAINLAMQKLERQRQNSSAQYSHNFVQIDDFQEFDGFDDVDVESLTLEDVLEDIHHEQPQDKVSYLQRRVQELTESLQQKLDEVEMLQEQIQELTESQKKCSEILLALQSENLTKTIKDAVVEVYRSLLSDPSAQ
ncbi:GAF domain-containing protein [Pseudanabaena sp. ABRG5-3]|uniref:GAF domain-containing protein n=1 Tax=Pseudanabaena sp. ABRG5-3 TaxID=685565 RepID=UPI000DC6F38A|nr:GAF domain-containing protein [Pseudanabaena sp. ABRG5-3]BBC25315.1 GAF domain protein [Pseudanabaena sp. ABRG5-3]